MSVADDRAAIEQVVRDYFESWFDARLSSRFRGRDRRPAEDGDRPQSEHPHPGCRPDLASVHVVSEPFYEYLHLARFGDAWLIVNSLYLPRVARRSSRPDPAGTQLDVATG